MRFRKGLIVAGLVLAGGYAAGYRADLPLAEVVTRHATPASHWVNVQGNRLHFTDRGTGPVVLMVHGSGAEQGAWDGIGAALMAQGFRTVALDLPGSGLSEAGPETGFTNSDLVALVSDFITAQGLGPVILMGHSTGGQIGWTLALDHPAQVARLVLVAPTGLPADSPLIWKLAGVPVLGAALRDITPDFVVADNLHQAFHDDTKVTPALVARYRDMILREGARKALFERMQAVSFARREELPCLTQPTLILWGAEDGWLPPALGEGFAAAIPGSQLHLIPGVGHDLPEEAEPALVAGLITGWLRAEPILHPAAGAPSGCPAPAPTL